MSNICDSTPFVPLYKKTYFIHKTIIRNDMDSLKHILSDGRRDTINDLDYSGRTPFHVALQQANPKALYLLLYYPLLHPSKMFATMDWTDLLDSLSLEQNVPSTSDNNTLHHIKKDPPTLEQVSDNRHNRSTRSGSSDPLDVNSLSSVGRALVNHWEKNPGDYLHSCLSLDERSQMNGCGVKEVENLYEQHYKFLAGEPHNLENAAKAYTKKYLRLYYPSYFKAISRECSMTTRSDSSNSMTSVDLLIEMQPEASGEKVEQSHSEESGTTQGESNTNHTSDNGCNKERSCMDKLISMMAMQTVEKLKKGRIELGTVDPVATFDKTSPLHLLFSNVYIATYRPNMLKCFRILIYYFNKSKEFSRMYRTLDYTMYFNAQSINKCLDLYRTQRSKRNRPKNEQKEVPSKRSKESEGQLTHQMLTRELIIDAMEEDVETLREDSEKEIPISMRNRTVAGKYPDARAINFPNNTMCIDATELAQRKERRNYALLNSSQSQTSELESCNYTLVEPGDRRQFALHDMILNSVTWAKPHVSWETFVKRPDFSRSTILHRVCNLKDHNMIRLVLSCGFSPIVVNEAGDMPVHMSVDANDPYGFLTILHSTLKELFYSRFNPRNYDIEVFFEEVASTKEGGATGSEGGEEGTSNKLSNEFYNMYMGHLCHNFFKMRENVNESFYRTIDHTKFTALSAMMDRDKLQLLLDEFLLLFEQLTYRCIKAWAWECLIALLSYNSVITYHLVSNPCFMHRFLNFANMNNNCDEFLNIVEFVLTNALFDTVNTREASPVRQEKTQPPTQVKGRTVKRDPFKGCGIPHLRLRSFGLRQCLKPLRGSGGPIFMEDDTLARLIRNYKGSTSCTEGAPKTWVITHPTCLHHLATPEPTDAPNKRHRLIVTYPENPTRLEVIISNDNGILRSDTLENVKLVHSPPPASLADILRVHDWGYIDKLLEQVQVAQKRWATNPYWPVLADGDTPVTPHSWSAALYAAGSVISAVDAVCTNMCKNAFCAVRPPGHHLGTWGGAQSSNFEDEDFAAGSQGFCLVNNVAIGAAYAKYIYANKGIRRIAIVDFDVHHGNGTEQVVRNIGPKNVKISSNSSDSSDASQPRTESVQKKWFGWRDENDRDDVLFASIHAYDGIFYPGTGQQCTLYQKENSANVINVAVPQGTSSAEFRALFETKICPYVYHFNPDLIFISAGFDGHYRDSVSYGFTRYTEKDFNYVTERLVTIANSVCEGRVVSVLEGGYNTKLNTLSPFARSVLEHVTALCNTRKDTMYPYMFGENSINYLLSSVIKTTSKTEESASSEAKHNEEMLSNLNYKLNTLTSSGEKAASAQPPPAEQPKSTAARKKNGDAVFNAYRIRTKTEMLIAKVYSMQLSCCKQARLLKLDKTQMCCKSVVELCGNQFLSFYSRYFYSLFAASNSTTTLPSVLGRSASSVAGSPSGNYSEHANSSSSSSSPEAARNTVKVESDLGRKHCVNKDSGDITTSMSKGERISEKARETTGGNNATSTNRNSNGNTSSNNHDQYTSSNNHDQYTTSTNSNQYTTSTNSNHYNSNGNENASSNDQHYAQGQKEDNRPQSGQKIEQQSRDPLNITTSSVSDSSTGDDGSAAQKNTLPSNPFNSPYENQNSEEDIENIVTSLKVMRDVNESNNLTTSNPWLASVKLRALEKSYQVALKLEAFYAKFGHLFNKTCDIHH
ncbi:uncharacterized protein TOT_030000917 [Theileria orientalis strain Shintoku]|uniref:Histone deacetylase domain-containing protein n=1 Tax=Theileria orientalis strain Shintoku TaxID=869250 RepID=J4C3V3_THEOR|nr:uncharacterized protein TOT_030000917 [Theileria orientalis strain Shintoku]BAM41091.1 uncharacterized protein TOT_030000917 [Theileria orientalis strain Shintoku]|eukprot:XP_009691392.1 uncharacterized protein TOT_030000917 [Theileria orientalis strain Shintoku]